MLDEIWKIGAWLSIAVFIGTAIMVTNVFLKWMTVNLVGAGRRIFVGVHAFTNAGVLYPHPLGRERTTNLVDPLVRPDAYPNPDRDEVRITIPVTPEGVGAEAGDATNQTVASLRVSWSVAKWTPFYDLPNEPGDHGGIIPENLRFHRDQLPPETVSHYVGNRIARCLPGQIEYFVPGAAALVMMNQFTKGEHLTRLYEFATAQTRAILGAIDYREFMRVRSINTDGIGEVKTLPRKTLLIRDHRVTLQNDDPTAADYSPLEYSNMGQFMQTVSQVLRRAIQLELEPYGMYINDVTLVDLQLPKRLVDAHRDREARESEVSSMERYSDKLAESVGRLQKAGVTPDIAGLLAADSISRESRPGVLGVLLSLTEKFLGRNTHN